MNQFFLEYYREFTIIKANTGGYYAEESPALYCASIEVLKKVIDRYWLVNPKIIIEPKLKIA